MKKLIRRIGAFLKGVIILVKPNLYLGWLQHPLMTIANILSLAKWIQKQDKSDIINDFYTPSRDYNKRYQLYKYIVEKIDLKDQPFDYLEFGVAQAHSFKWWSSTCNNKECRFYGFDTFEGLPENWGTFNKGDMIAGIPSLNDNRCGFIKGLFQETLIPFLRKTELNNGKRKIIHMDADLFSSTIFTLTTLTPYLNAGDILIFDEFNVPNHEFQAFKIFSESFYIKTKLLGAVNNYFQVALIIVD